MTDREKIFWAIGSSHGKVEEILAKLEAFNVSADELNECMGEAVNLMYSTANQLTQSISSGTETDR